MGEFVCPECGKEARSKAGLSAHQRSHPSPTAVQAPEVDPGFNAEQPEPDPSPEPVSKEPAILPNQSRARRLMAGGRAVTMIRPVCRQCDPGDRQPTPGWWRTCPHDPYVAAVPHTYEVPQYEDIPDDPSRKKVVGTTKEVQWEVQPNWKEVVINQRTGGQSRVGQALQRGCIFPQNLRSKAYPNGIAECCQFRDCHQQTQPDGRPLIKTQYGAFCREIEAKFAQIDQTGFASADKRFEVGFNGPSVEKQQKQLEQMTIR